MRKLLAVTGICAGAEGPSCPPARGPGGCLQQTVQLCRADNGDGLEQDAELHKVCVCVSRSSEVCPIDVPGVDTRCVLHVALQMLED